MLADDHSLVDVLAGADEHRRALLQPEQRHAQGAGDDDEDLHEVGVEDRAQASEDGVDAGGDEDRVAARGGEDLMWGELNVAIDQAIEAYGAAAP